MIAAGREPNPSRRDSVVAAGPPSFPAGRDRFVVLLAGLASLGLYVVLATLGDLRARLEIYLAIHAALFLVYGFVVLRIVRGARRRPRPEEGTPAPERTILQGLRSSSRA